MINWLNDQLREFEIMVHKSRFIVYRNSGIQYIKILSAQTSNRCVKCFFITTKNCNKNFFLFPIRFISRFINFWLQSFRSCCYKLVWFQNISPDLGIAAANRTPFNCASTREDIRWMLFVFVMYSIAKALSNPPIWEHEMLTFFYRLIKKN